MEIMLKEYPTEVEIGSTMESFQKAIDSQKNLLHSQIDDLRSVVVTHCRLTGVNPLSQEMAAGALSIKIGKRPRDLINPKALQYMQAVFAIKDAINKKEIREIGALFGLTVTQVKEYFASQRTRVRKMVRISREKAIRTSVDEGFKDSTSAEVEPMLPVDPVPLSSVGPPSAEETPSCSNQDESLPGLGDSDKQFVENIFSSMCKEETFSGQVKLLEWILRIENPSVLSWFLLKGGVMILATWLSQAASEEQTSVLSTALKVLCHLPLNKALSAHMAAILQGVNKLRFYRTPDISNRARVLLSKWSKMFAKSQALKKTNGIRTAGTSQQEINLSQRIGELMGDESWQSSVDNPDGLLVPFYASPDDVRKSETQEDMKLLTASSDDSNKKYMLGTCSAHNKERRKVQLVEQPGQKSTIKSQPVKSVHANQTRPITADEIQKAKMRAQFMQSNKTNIEGPKKRSLLTNDLLSASEAYLRPKLEAQKKARLLTPKSSKQEESPSKQKPSLDHKETLLEKCRRVQIPWQAPPEVQLSAAWGVGTGENSKEVEVQKNRIRREKETIYRTLQEVPPNPKEPWDIEMDYDDTLTPEIPIDQLPDADGIDVPSGSLVAESQNTSVVPEKPASTSTQAAAEPDLELLAVLLKNPELVFALTSGQASGLSSEDTVKLLDVLKSSGGATLLNGQAAKPEEKRIEVSLPSPTPTRNVEVTLPSPTPPSRVEVSLPSPTPSSNPGPSGWTSQAAKNPFSRQIMPGVATVVTASDRPQNTYAVESQFTTGLVVPQLPQHLSSQTPVSATYESSFIRDSQSTHIPSQTQIPPTNYQPTNRSMINAAMPDRLHNNIPLYSRHPQQPHTAEYQVPEDSNMGIVKSRNHGLAQNSFSSAPGSQNVYDPAISGMGAVIQPGPQPERNEFYSGGHKGGYESWSPENSPGPAMYPPVEHHHGQGWAYAEQRGYRRGPPPDRLSRNQNSPGFRDRNWHGGGSGNRRWHDSDRRR